MFITSGLGIKNISVQRKVLINVEIQVKRLTIRMHLHLSRHLNNIIRLKGGLCLGADLINQASEFAESDCDVD